MRTEHLDRNRKNTMNRMFLVEKEKWVIIRDENGIEVSFTSFDEFYKFCPISEFGVDLTGKVYIDYEPDRNFYIDSVDPDITLANAPNTSFENLIDNVYDIWARKNDRFFGLSLTDAKTLKISMLKKEAMAKIYSKWPNFKQINYALGILGYTDETIKAEMKSDIETIISECDASEVSVNNCLDVDAIKAISISWSI